MTSNSDSISKNISVSKIPHNVYDNDEFFFFQVSIVLVFVLLCRFHDSYISTLKASTFGIHIFDEQLVEKSSEEAPDVSKFDQYTKKNRRIPLRSELLIDRVHLLNIECEISEVTGVSCFFCSQNGRKCSLIFTSYFCT